MAGLYTILKQVGHAYRLELPPVIKIHPVILANKLHKAANDLLLTQIQELGLLIIVNEQEELDVDKILAL
jgi:hypothetical protein